MDTKRVGGLFIGTGSTNMPIFKSAFNSWRDEFAGKGVRPVVFDILGPDWETSILPEDLKLVLHVNPNQMAFKYSKAIERQHTKSGFIEYHWGDSADGITFEMASGGFMRLYTGMTATTGVGPMSATGISLGGSRRETIAYDKYLDMLALFHNNGAVYDTKGAVALQGQIKCSFDGGVWYGWFNTFSVSEEATRPYLFSLTADFTIQREEIGLRFK